MIIKKKKINGALVAACMFLTGLCVLMMFSMQDPLNDELHGVGMGQGIVCGLIACILFQCVDFVKFYQNSSKVGFDIPVNIFIWLFKPYRQKVAGLANTLKSDKGIIKKLFALVIVLLTLPFLLLDLLQITRLNKPIGSLCEKLLLEEQQIAFARRERLKRQLAAAAHVLHLIDGSRRTTPKASDDLVRPADHLTGR